MSPSTVLLVVAAASFLGGVIELGLAWVASREFDVPAARPFMWLSLTAAAWAFLQSIYLLSTSPETALSLYRLQQVVAVQIPALWLVFTLVYTGRRDWLTAGRVLALWTVPVGYTVALFTAPHHGLAVQTVSFPTVNGVTAPLPNLGLAFAVQTALSYAYILAGYALLLRFLVRTRAAYRNQTAAIVLGSLFPLAGNALYVAGGGVHPGVELTPVTLVVHGVVIAWALFRYDFLAVSPVAGNVLVDELPEPILLVDAAGEVVDWNPAAAALARTDTLEGTPADEAVPGLSDHLASGDQMTVDPGAYAPDRDRAVFDLQTTAIEDHYGRQRGQLVLMRDVTTQQRRLDQLRALQSATREFIGARTDRQVAVTAVESAERVLDCSYALVLRRDDGDAPLTDAAATDAAADRLDGEVSVLPGSDPLWPLYEDGDDGFTRVDPERVPATADWPVASLLVFPLGDHGLLVLGPEAGTDLTTEDEQFARILARTTETALTRVANQRELRERRTALRRRNEQVAFFNGVLRHSIRNAMLVIDGHADYLADTLDEGQAELATIREWCDDLTELTEKVRAINETVSASESQRLGEVDLSAAIAEQVRAVTEDHPEVGVETAVGEDLVVEANHLVADVLRTVLRNAVEHNDAADPELTVETVPAGDWVQVRIADNGPGLPDEMKEQVFEREMATSDTAEGFGLYFVSVMMDVYGGKVWFEDNDPRGAVVVLEFRLAAEAPMLAEH